MIVTNLISIFEQKTHTGNSFKTKSISSHSSRPNSTPNEKSSMTFQEKSGLPVPPPRTVSNRRPRRKTCAITLSSVSTDSGNSSPGQTSPSEMCSRTESSTESSNESSRNSRTSSVSSADETHKKENVIINENMAVNFGQNYQNKVRIQPLSKVVNFTNHNVNNTKYRVHVNDCANPFSRDINRFSYVPQVQDLREEKVDLDEVEDITSESKLESMLETAKDYDDRKKIRSALRNMKKKRHDAQLKKTTESKKKEDENLVKSAGGQTKQQQPHQETTKEFTTMQQQAAPAPVSASQNARKEQKYTRSVTMDASMINRGNGVVQKQYNSGNGMSGSVSGMQSANPPTTPGGSYAKPTFGSNQFTSGGSRASSGERKNGANFQIGSQRSSPVENQQTNLFKNNNAIHNSSQMLKKGSTTSTTTNSTVSSSSNKFQSSQQTSQQSLLKQQSETTTTSSSQNQSSQNQPSTSNSSKLARNKSMPASSLSKKEQFLAKLEQNADPNRGVGSGGGSSFKNARSAFNGAGSSSGSVKRGSSFVVPNATGVKQLLLRWCQQRTNGYDHVEVTNFSSSWASGMAFCALIHSFFPESFNYEELSPANRAHNFELAFSAAEQLAEIPRLLDVEDMAIMPKPDWKCIYTYLCEFYKILKTKGLCK